MKKWKLILLGIFVVAFGLSFMEVFPDPYTHVSQVNFWTWLQREIDELLHGEKP